MINLQKGSVYETIGNGPVEYIGIDRYLGHSSYQFRRLNDGQMTYIRPDTLDEFLAPDESIETVKQQRDELVAALRGVADTLDELSQEQSIARLQGGAAGAASGIRKSIIKIAGGAA